MQNLKAFFIYCSGGEEIDLEAIEEEILREQLRLRSLKMKSSDQYKILEVLRCM